MADPQPTPMEQFAALCADLGVTVTPAGVERARRRRLAAERDWPAHRWAALRARVERDAAAMFPDLAA